MKKLVKYGVLPACLLLLAACSSKPGTEKKATKEDKVEQSSESKEEKTKKQIEKDGEGLTRTNHRSNIVETTKDSTDNCHEVIIV